MLQVSQFGCKFSLFFSRGCVPFSFLYHILLCFTWLLLCFCIPLFHFLTLASYFSHFLFCQAIWTGEFYPNASTDYSANSKTHSSCSKSGCLFDVGGADPGEHVDLAPARPQDVARMSARVDEIRKSEKGFKPSRGNQDPRACSAIDSYGGFFGPWIE